MSAPTDGGPAFPGFGEIFATDAAGNTGTQRAWGLEGSVGMSLRDWFAGRAMQGIISKLPLFDRQGEYGLHAPSIEEIHGIRKDIARSAYNYADAMLDARGEPAKAASDTEIRLLLGEALAVFQTNDMGGTDLAERIRAVLR